MNKMDLALNSLQWLVCHKNQTKPYPNQINLASNNHNGRKFDIQRVVIPNCHLQAINCFIAYITVVVLSTVRIKKEERINYSKSGIILYDIQHLPCPVGWGCRIHRLLLCRGVRTPPPNECPGYDTKQSDGEVPAMLELWEMWSTPLLPSHPGPLWPGVVAPDKGPIYGLNRTNSILMLN